MEVDPGLAGYDEARGRQAHLALMDRLRTVPGVEAVTIGSSLPFTSIRGQSRRRAGRRSRCASRDPWTPYSASSAAITRGSSDFPCLAAVISATPNWHPAPASAWRSSTMRSRRSCGRERTHSDG